MLTLILSKILALYLIVTGLGFILSPKFFVKMIKGADKSDPVLINLSGMVHFLIGAAIVTNHFLWGTLLEGFVTGLGIAFLLKGAFLIALPQLTLKSNKTSVKFFPVFGIIFIAVGLFIGYLACRPIYSEPPIEKPYQDNLGQACQTNDDCKTPMEYMIQSNCPFGAACINNTCRVVCPLFFHDPNPEISKSHPFQCREDKDCDCSGRGSRTIECKCLSGSCVSVEA
jgi:uncharacterized protein YjeT (DUF2065 family)